MTHWVHLTCKFSRLLLAWEPPEAGDRLTQLWVPHAALHRGGTQWTREKWIVLISLYHFNPPSSNAPK